MSTGTTKSPALPVAPIEYSRDYQDQLNNILRLYFAQLDNPGASAGSAQRLGNTVVAALNFSVFDGKTAGNTSVSFATSTDEAAGRLRIGDVYYDVATNVLKIKVS
jgi:hypothetical protein